MSAVTNDINDGYINNNMHNPLEVYPVGSIYMSVNNTNPATLFGGTWEQIKDVFLLSAGDTYSAGSTGGSATHTLTTDEIPPHNHLVTSATTTYGPGNQPAWQCLSWTGTNHDYNNNVYSGNTGGGKPHSIMPPYLTVYIWKRTV